jgi:hypothetical protein
VVIPQGGFQMENGLLASNLGNGAVVDLPESFIRYGLLPRTKLRITVPDYYYSLASAPAVASGFGDTAIGAKQQLGPLGGFDVSTIAFSSFPTGAKQVSSHGHDPGLQIPWSRSLAGNLNCGGPDRRLLAHRGRQARLHHRSDGAARPPVERAVRYVR